MINGVCLGGTIHLISVGQRGHKSMELVLGPGWLDRRLASAYLANYATIRRMAMVVPLNADTWNDQKENFAFYLREVDLPLVDAALFCTE